MTIGRHSAVELDPSLDDYQLASALVREAGQLALLMRMAGLQSQQKTSVSDVVTAADHAAEAYVLEQLRRCRPEDGILGEEGASVQGTSGRTWVIDPVDGTYNFLHGSTYWCSAIALKDSSDVLLGRHLPARGGQALAGRQAPARHPERRDPEGVPRRPGSPQRAPPLPNWARPPTSTPRWLMDPLCAMPWHAAATSAAALRMLGSGSCDLGRVADGQLGCWFQHSCPEWDWLPGKAIVRAAGGAVDTVRVNGLEWFMAGGTTAVRELRAALESGSVA